MQYGAATSAQDKTTTSLQYMYLVLFVALDSGQHSRLLLTLELVGGLQHLLTLGRGGWVDGWVWVWVCMGGCMNVSVGAPRSRGSRGLHLPRRRAASQLLLVVRAVLLPLAAPLAVSSPHLRLTPQPPQPKGAPMESGRGPPEAWPGGDLNPDRLPQHMPKGVLFLSKSAHHAPRRRRR